MPTRPEPPPKTWLELLNSVLGDPSRTRNAIRLLLTCALALALALAPILLVASLFGTTGAAIVGGAGTLATAGGYAVRRGRQRATEPKAVDSPTTRRTTRP